MRLNKFQRAWIAKLKSGTSRKFKGALRDPERGAYCCLGVACHLAGEPMHPDDVCLFGHPDVMNKLKLNSSMGQIDIDKVKPQWRSMLDLTDHTGNKAEYSLASLNDYGQISHQKIGEFIDANREAVFVG